jgi:hypothetical protein
MVGPMSRRLLATLLAACTVAGATTGITLALRHGSSAAPAAVVQRTPPPSPSFSPSPSPTASPTPLPWVPGTALPRTLQATLDLHAAYASVPLRFQAPTVGIDVPVLGVGLTSGNAVDAPKGARNSPLWDEGFWYRGGAEPGQPGVFALAGHVDRVGGGAAAFATLHNIKVGDVVTLLDERSGVAWRYRISDTQSFGMNHVDLPSVLARIYGPDVAAGKTATVPADMTARISIITCAGTWTGQEYDHRFVVFGELVGPAA